jgi:hypothetical protein
LALKFEVALVCNDDDGERVLILHAQDLLVERAYFLERLLQSDRVDEQKAFAGPHVLLTHGTVKGGDGLQGCHVVAYQHVVELESNRFSDLVRVADERERGLNFAWC